MHTLKLLATHTDGGLIRASKAYTHREIETALPASQAQEICESYWHTVQTIELYSRKHLQAAQ